MGIKLVAWDVYGTIIKSGFCDDERVFPRPGAIETLAEISSAGIEQCTCSDGNLENLKNNLKEIGVDWMDFFIDLYKFTPYQQKDFGYVIEANGLIPENLLVIGDNYEIDLRLAERMGCNVFHVPEVNTRGDNPIDTKEIIKRLKYYSLYFLLKLMLYAKKLFLPQKKS
jgi:FMN phosphatase YigB (HAD superfamily)